MEVVLGWQYTYLPPGGATKTAQQVKIYTSKSLIVQIQIQIMGLKSVSASKRRHRGPLSPWNQPYILLEPRREEEEKVL